MPTFRISWQWDGTTEGEAEIEARDEDEARSEAWARFIEMTNERGGFRAEQVDD